MKRETRIKRAEAKLKALRPWIKKIEKAQTELKIAQATFDVGETATWTEYYGNHGRDVETNSAKVMAVSRDGREVTLQVWKNGAFVEVKKNISGLERPRS